MYGSKTTYLSRYKVAINYFSNFYVAYGYPQSSQCNATFQGCSAETSLESVCCKKKQKKSSWPVTSLWNMGPLKILNGIKWILDDQGNQLDSYWNQFGIIQDLQRSPIPQTSNWSGTFFAVSYSKLALIFRTRSDIGQAVHLNYLLNLKLQS